MVRQVKVYCKGDVFTGSHRFNPGDSASFIHIWIRGKMKLEPNEALFIMVNNTMINPTKTIGEILKEHGDTQKRLIQVEAQREVVFG